MAGACGNKKNYLKDMLTSPSHQFENFYYFEFIKKMTIMGGKRNELGSSVVELSIFQVGMKDGEREEWGRKEEMVVSSWKLTKMST